MSTVFQTFQRGLVSPPPSRRLSQAEADALMRQDEAAFEKARVRHFLTAEVAAMRAAGFNAELVTNSIGVPNFEVRWRPIRAGEAPDGANAEFNIAATGDGAYTGLIHFTNDEDERVSFPLRAHELTEAVVTRWFSTFVEACLVSQACR